MGFGGFNDNQHQAPMVDINVTPLVDVMLVLLVIFIITAPLLTHAIKLDLPSAQAAPAPEKPETVAVSINSAGEVFWAKEAIDLSALAGRFAETAKKQPQPEVQLRADKDTRYDMIAKVMAAAQNNGITKLGFVTEARDLPDADAAAK